MNRAQRRVVVWLGVVLPLMVVFPGRADAGRHPIPAVQVFIAVGVWIALGTVLRFVFRPKRRVPSLPPHREKLVRRLKLATWLLLAVSIGQVVAETVRTGFLVSWHPLRISLPLCGAWVSLVATDFLAAGAIPDDPESVRQPTR